MNTKIIYVVVCNETNYYLEQALLSIITLKKYNPEAKAYIVTDNESGEFIKSQSSINNAEIEEIIQVNVPSKYNSKQKSRYLKTNLRQIIEGDLLFVDTDTIFVDNISEIDEFEFNIAAVLDKHLPIHKHLFKEDIIKFSSIFNWDIRKCNLYFNSGIMYVKDNELTRNFYSLWYKYWETGSNENNINIDQPSLAKANEESGFIINEINGIYNCQINENGLRYFFNSKIIHYFASNLGGINDSSFILANKDIFRSFRNEGLTSEIEELLDHPKLAFNEKCTILGGNQCDVYRYPLVRLAKKISIRIPYINKIIKKISSLHKIGE